MRERRFHHRVFTQELITTILNKIIHWKLFHPSCSHVCHHAAQWTLYLIVFWGVEERGEGGKWLTGSRQRKKGREEGGEGREGEGREEGGKGREGKGREEGKSEGREG